MELTKNDILKAFEDSAHEKTAEIYNPLENR